MKVLNLGIVAHVDAGKTSLTERLLFTAGVIDEIGSVDAGSTQTDSLALERQRGITIKAAVVSFVIGGVTVNLIDTPGHPDFIAEVERVLGVLDGAVLVVSAVEGVQAQTRILMRTLRRLRIPTLIFANKVDRAGAQDAGLLASLAAALSPSIVALGTTERRGTRGAEVRAYRDDELRPRLLDLLAGHDDRLLAAYVRDEAAVSDRWLAAVLAEQTARAVVHPVCFGSAITGAGVDDLVHAVTRLLPGAVGDPDGPLAGTVFKVDRGPAGERIAYVRMFSGTLRVRDRLLLPGRPEAKVTAISVFDRGGVVRGDAVPAGRIAKVWGLGAIRIGDAIGGVMGGAVGGAGRLGGQQFAPPSLETVLVPRSPAQRGTLHHALSQLAEQDPLINLRQDDVGQELSVSLYGEVQKEVIEATLANEYGVSVTFRETTTICVERPVGTGSAYEIIAKEPNPFLATVGLRVEPGELGSGISFRLEVEPGSLPLAFLTAVEETVHQTLRQGLYGWEVTDCVVTMTHSGYWARQSRMHGSFDKSMSSTAGDFRNLTPLVLMNALGRAGTAVFEPMHRFRLEVPADTYPALLPVLARLRVLGPTPTMRGALCLLEGEIPAAQVHTLRQELPGLTRGEATLESAFERYAPVVGAIPSRIRSDHNPLNRKEYLLHVTRRV